MALDTPQRASIRRYLGWPGKHHQTDSGLEMAMDQLSNQADDLAIVIGLIGKCDGIMAELDLVPGTLEATKVGSIQLRGAYQLQTLRSLGRTFVSQLSAILGVEVKVNPFGSVGARSRGGNYCHHG